MGPEERRRVGLRFYQIADAARCHAARAGRSRAARSRARRERAKSPYDFDSAVHEAIVLRDPGRAVKRISLAAR
jgi:hypothetical protein